MPESRYSDVDFKLADEFESLSLDQLGDWARYAFELGARSFPYDAEDVRLVTIVSVPARDVFAPIVALGALVAEALSFDGTGLLDWDEFLKLDNGTKIFFIDNGQKWRSGVLDSFDDGLSGRRVIDMSQRSPTTHFILKSNFKEKCVAFKKSTAVTGSVDNEEKIKRFLCAADQEQIGGWLRTVKPKIAINSVKTIFKASVQDLFLRFGNNNSLRLIDLLKITEEESPGSGKLLLKSAGNAASDSTYKLAILNTARYEKSIKKYASSNIIVLLEHQEYDEEVAALTGELRKSSRALPNELQYLDKPCRPVLSCPLILQRY